jgi:hypothetical protein
MLLKEAEPVAAPADVTEKEKMEQRLKTAKEKKIYRKRKELTYMH